MAKLKIDTKALAEVNRRIENALIMTGQDVITDIIEADIVPYMRGMLEGTLEPLDVSDVKQHVVRIHSNTPYARRLYYHPEYNFHRAPWSITHRDGRVETFPGNPNAQAEWFEPWISGNRQDFVKSSFAYYMENLK